MRSPAKRQAPRGGGGGGGNGFRGGAENRKHHQPQLFQNHRSKPITKIKTPVLHVGVGMFCLVLLYAVVVITVTSSHVSDQKQLSSTSAEQEIASRLQSSSRQHKEAERLVNNNTARDSIKRLKRDIAGSSERKKQEAETKKREAERKKEEETKKKEEESRRKEEEKDKKKKNSPFGKNNLNTTLEHGVKPVLLAETDMAAVKAAAVYRVDPPLEEHPTPTTILTAYLEAPNFDEWEQMPLPVRSRAQASLLERREYTRVNSCQRLTQQWPVDDTPAEDDPFLPWIHDVFPTADGKYIQFVAQNRRRCRTGVNKLNETDILLRMQPQVALFQHVPITRLKASDATSTRYRLSTHKEADADGMATRFICRFKPGMQETLSVFNFDYDWISIRKKYKGSFWKENGGIKSIHTSQLIFRCPVPAELQEAIRTGQTVQNDFATNFVDLIPIRTPPRYGPAVQYLQPRYKEFQETNESLVFDDVKNWGREHVLPEIQNAGRWENIPICLPSLMQYENQTVADLPAAPQERQEKHRLVSCIWASAGYTTRGNRFAVNDGQRRLLEWLSYNIVTGFDHFYLYDNSGAFESTITSLKPIADLFPDKVTYVPWPSQICNNRPNNVDSPGERSSQYAAESSCRLRFGPHVKWIGQFDVDEYLVPMGKYQTVTALLDTLEKEDTRIISFGSWRAWPRRAFINPIVPIKDQDVCWHNEPCFELSVPTNVTLLQAYNCDQQPPGQKIEVMPAEKQVYRADYVTHHFIHYSAVTKLSEKNRSEWIADWGRWKPRGFPDPRQRFGSETKEALMLHSKAVAVQDTAGYQRMCTTENLKKPIRRQGRCRLGIPWPKDQLPKDVKHPPIAGRPDGLAYNCYVNDQIEDILVPRLESELNKRSSALAGR